MSEIKAGGAAAARARSGARSDLLVSLASVQEAGKAEAPGFVPQLARRRGSASNAGRSSSFCGLGDGSCRLSLWVVKLESCGTFPSLGLRALHL